MSAAILLRIQIGDRAAGLLERLVAALERLPLGAAAVVASDERDDRQPGGSPPAPVTQAPCPAPAAEAGAAAGEVAGTSPPPPVAGYHAESGRRFRKDRGQPREAPWRTAEREVLFRRLWAEGVDNKRMVAEIGALPGEALPRWPSWIHSWGELLGLPEGSRPAARVRARQGAAGPPAPTGPAPKRPAKPPPAVAPAQSAAARWRPAGRGRPEPRASLAVAPSPPARA